MKRRSRRPEPHRGYRPPSNVDSEVRLSRPIRAYGDELDVIPLRRATLKDLKRMEAAGLNLAALATGDLSSLTTDALTEFVVHCGNIPRGSAEQIDLADWSEVVDAWLDMFAGDEEDEDGDPTSPTTGESSPRT